MKFLNYLIFQNEFLGRLIYTLISSFIVLVFYKNLSLRYKNKKPKHIVVLCPSTVEKTGIKAIQKVNVINGIKIVGVKNLMNKLPITASSLYAKNLFSFIRNLYSREKKVFNLNMEDEIINKTLIRELN